jgi:hypothetical protein
LLAAAPGTPSNARDDAADHSSDLRSTGGREVSRWLSTKAAPSRPASKRVNSSKADADDATLIEPAELATA